MLENIYRHMEMGEEPMEASLVGSAEIGFTIVSMTLSLAAVFIPVLFMGGVLGRLFREFSVTICVAILISGVVSVTLTPMLCSRFLKKPSHRPNGSGEAHDASPAVKVNWFYDLTERGFQGMFHFYDRTLTVVLRLSPRATPWAPGSAVLFLTIALFVLVPKGFIPDQDTDQISITTEAAQSTAYEDQVASQNQISNTINQDPNVVGLVSTIGGTTASTLGGPNLGQIVVTLKPRDQRKEGVEEIMARLRPQLASVPGMAVFMQSPPTIQIGGQVSKSRYQYSLQSPDKQQLYAATRTLEKALADVPGIQDLTSDLEITSPQVQIDINRDKAASLGVTSSQVEAAFYDACGLTGSQPFYAPVNEYKVLTEVEPRFQTDPTALSSLYFKSTGTNPVLVPLASLASVKRQVGPQTVDHYGQLTSATLSFGLATGTSLGSVLGGVKQVADNTLPEGVTGQFQGAAKAFQGALSNLAVLLVIAVLVVYIVLRYSRIAP